MIFSGASDFREKSLKLKDYNQGTMITVSSTGMEAGSSSRSLSALRSLTSISSIQRISRATAATPCWRRELSCSGVAQLFAAPMISSDDRCHLVRASPSRSPITNLQGNNPRMVELILLFPRPTGRGSLSRPISSSANPRIRFWQTAS